MILLEYAGSRLLSKIRIRVLRHESCADNKTTASLQKSGSRHPTHYRKDSEPDGTHQKT